MATLTFKNRTIPLAINLSIDGGAKPNASLCLSDDRASVVVSLMHNEVMKMAMALMIDPRFNFDTAKWTKKDREAFDNDMENFIKENGL